MNPGAELTYMSVDIGITMASHHAQTWQEVLAYIEGQ